MSKKHYPGDDPQDILEDEQNQQPQTVVGDNSPGGSGADPEFVKEFLAKQDNNSGSTGMMESLNS